MQAVQAQNAALNRNFEDIETAFTSARTVQSTIHAENQKLREQLHDVYAKVTEKQKLREQPKETAHTRTADPSITNPVLEKQLRDAHRFQWRQQPRPLTRNHWPLS